MSIPLFIAGVIPGIVLATLFSGYIAVWTLLNPSKIPAATARYTRSSRSLRESRHLIPVVLLIVAGALGQSMRASPRQTGGGCCRRCRLAGAVGSARCAVPGRRSGEPAGSHPALLHDCDDPDRCRFPDTGDGLSRSAPPPMEFIQGLGLSQFTLVIALAIFYIILGCFLDGISMVVLTMGLSCPRSRGRARPDLVWYLHHAGGRDGADPPPSASICSCCGADQARAHPHRAGVCRCSS